MVHIIMYNMVYSIVFNFVRSIMYNIVYSMVYRIMNYNLYKIVYNILYNIEYLYNRNFITTIFSWFVYLVLVYLVTVRETAQRRNQSVHL